MTTKEITLKMQAINPQRRAEKKEMQELGIKTKKAFRKHQKKQRRERLAAANNGDNRK